MRVSRIGQIKEAGKEPSVVGNRTRVKVVKNKLAPPFREAEFDIIYGTGISFEGDLLDLAVEKNIVEKSGSWFSYGTDRIGQGRENAKSFIRDNPDIRTRLEGEVRAAYGLGPAPGQPEVAGANGEDAEAAVATPAE